MIDNNQYDYAYNYTYGHYGHPDEGTVSTYRDERDGCMHYDYTNRPYYEWCLSEEELEECDDEHIILLEGPPEKHIVTRWFEHA